MEKGIKIITTIYCRGTEDVPGVEGGIWILKRELLPDSVPTVEACIVNTVQGGSIGME